MKVIDKLRRFRNKWGGASAESSSSADTFSRRFANVPEHLVVKVNGAPDETNFTDIGAAISRQIAASLRSLKESRRVLDFGCGLGRVLRPMMKEAPGADFVAYDIDPLMLVWGEYLLEDSRCRFVHSTRPLHDESFDVIYAISVFTHLEATTDYWLTEVHRLLSPNGQAFLTYIDETLFMEDRDKISESERTSESQEGGAETPSLRDRYVMGRATSEGGALKGTYYTTAFWEKTVGKYFEIDSTVPRGVFGHQSYSVVRKKPGPIDRARAVDEYLGTLEEELFQLRQRYGTVF